MIAPGLSISAEALFARAAKLPRVEIARPPHGRRAQHRRRMQSGLVYGYAGLVDALVERIKAEVDFPPRVHRDRRAGAADRRARRAPSTSATTC